MRASLTLNFEIIDKPSEAFLAEIVSSCSELS
jgi:hypothetical protein